jgi:hypothetical protein
LNDCNAQVRIDVASFVPTGPPSSPLSPAILDSEFSCDITGMQ